MFLRIKLETVAARGLTDVESMLIPWCNFLVTALVGPFQFAHTCIGVFKGEDFHAIVYNQRMHASAVITWFAVHLNSTGEGKT